MPRAPRLPIACLALLIPLAGCAPSTPPASDPGAAEESPSEASSPAEPRLSVYTVNYPLAYFAERIGGDFVAVSFPAPAEVDPAFWSPDPDAVAAYQSADLILLNGADYAKWVPRVTLPVSKLVDTSAGLEDRRIPLENTVTHTHGPGGEHTHTGWAASFWLDPTLARQQAEAVLDALVGALPDAEGTLQEGYEALAADLGELDREMEAAFAPLAAEGVVVSHPTYQYLDRRYGLEARALDWQADEVPEEQGWTHLESDLAERPAALILWEAEPLPETRSRLEEMGLRIAVFDPVANRPPEGDWLSRMRANLASLDAP